MIRLAAHRNPFARREPAKSANPFARNGNGGDAGQKLGKSTSFFERVDDIQGNAKGECVTLNDSDGS